MFQDALRTLPFAATAKLVGVPGAAHAPGVVTVTLLDEPLEPALLYARSDSVYVPAGTPGNEKVCDTGTPSEPVNAPVTSSVSPVAAPPPLVLVQERLRLLPVTEPCRFAGGVGGDTAAAGGGAAVTGGAAGGDATVAGGAAGGNADGGGGAAAAPAAVRQGSGLIVPFGGAVTNVAVFVNDGT